MSRGQSVEEGHLHVRSEGCQGKRKRHEEGSWSVRPLIDEVQRVPQDLPVVEDDPRARNRNTDEPEEGERDGDDDKLDVLASEHVGSVLNPKNE